MNKREARLRLMIQEEVGPIIKDAVVMIRQQARATDENTMAAIKQIQPAAVDLTQEMADDIVRKIHGPLTISQNCSDWLRKMAEFKDVYQTFNVGYGPDMGRLDMRIATDGRLTLILENFNGERQWFGTFVPPDFGTTP